MDTNSDTSFSHVTKASKPDWRVKLSRESKLLLIEKAQAGESQKMLADEFKICQQRVSQIVTAYEKQQARAAAEAARGGPEVAYFAQRDCTQGLGLIADDSVDLLLTDPPYWTDVAEPYGDFVDRWFSPALAKVKATGRAYIFCSSHPKEIAAYSRALQQEDRFELSNLLVWVYHNTLGPISARHYVNNCQCILYLVGVDAPPLNAGSINSASNVIEINAPDGRHEIKFHPWQKPDALAELLISHGSDPGDAVLDLFAGSGTFGLAAARFGRTSLSFESDEQSFLTCLARGGQAHEG